MHNKHNPTDSVQGPEQPPSMLDALCLKNGYDKILPEAEEAVDNAPETMSDFVTRATKTLRQRDMLLEACKGLLVTLECKGHFSCNYGGTGCPNGDDCENCGLYINYCIAKDATKECEGK